MSDYTKLTDFASKDALLSGNPSKLIRGSEHDAEYNAIATAIATKFDSSDLGVSVAAPPTLAASVATTSGATAEISGIPSTATRVTVMIKEVSFTDSSPTPLLRLGTSGSILSAGYNGFYATGGAFTLAGGFNLNSPLNTATSIYGVLTLTKYASNTWFCSGYTGGNGSGYTVVAGYIDLGGALTRVQLVASTAFDGGSFNIMYE